ncbi:uncharacterized protein LOC142229211 [Haematobia irritans]|uniref:uncharacterized protein LOC142229211 n=1 Tax=Haematobia irritans TaxID=7368 RepID=UPI003F4FA6DC
MYFISYIAILLPLVNSTTAQKYGIENLLSLKHAVNVSELIDNINHFSMEFFFKQTSEMSVIRSASDPKAQIYFDELLRELLKPLNDIKLRLNNVDTDYQHKYGYFNIVLIDSFENFRKIDLGPASMTQDFNEYYLIVFYGDVDNYPDEIQKIFEYYWLYYIVNVALLLVLDGKSNDLYTYYPFTSAHCHRAQIRKLNEENVKITTLKANELFPEKFLNFHKCTLIAAVWEVPPYLTLPQDDEENIVFGGVEGLLLNILAKELNFKMDFKTPPNNEQRGLVLPDGSLTGAIKMLNERVADISMGSFRCTLQRSTVLTPSSTFYQTFQVFAVLALKQALGSFEVITYPFDIYIWFISLGLTLGLVASSYLCSVFNKKILKFIYDTTSLSIINANIIAITLGQPTIGEQRRNFARYFATLWVLWTFVLRSTYQGALFDFLNSQKTIDPPDTTKELTERNYRLVVNLATSDAFSGVPSIRDKQLQVQIMNVSDTGMFPVLEENPDKPLVSGSPRDFLVHYVNSFRKFGVFHVLPEAIFSQQLCVYFSKHSYLVNIFDHLLKNLRSFGLIDHWAKQVFDDRFLETLPANTETIPLSLSHVSSVFMLCVYAYGFSTLVFIIEVIWFKCNERHSKNRENIHISEYD